MDVPAFAKLDRLLPWLLRLLWVVVLVTGGSAVDGATADVGGSVAETARYGALLVWIAGVVAMAVPAVVSLTAVRVIVPATVPVAVVALTAGTETVRGVLFLAVGLVSTMLVLSADLGRVYVQASAYGEEDRHLLRPPAAYAIASIVTWSICVALLIVGPLATADGRWITGLSSTVAGVGITALGWPRWHRLAQRWFVVVPVGVVIHDQLVLAETIMLRRQDLSRIRLAPVGTDAADLTGPAAGHAVEISTVEITTAIFAATPKQPQGNAIHLRACLIAPTRPGRALRAAATRRLPVG